MRLFVALVAAVVLMPQAAVHAQEKKDPGIYKVEFTIRDSSGAAPNAGQRYTLLMEPNRKAVLKMGSRVPVVTGSFEAGAGGNAIPTTQYTYIDVGVDIQCTVSEMDGRIAMHGSIDMSTVREHDTTSRASEANPTVGQTKLELDTAVEPGKPTVVAAIDDAANGRHFQVEATVSRTD